MTHSVIIHALMVSWYPKRRIGNPTGDVMMDLDPRRSPGMVKMVEEAHEAPCLMKKPLKKYFDPTHMIYFGLHGGALLLVDMFDVHGSCVL